MELLYICDCETAEAASARLQQLNSALPANPPEDTSTASRALVCMNGLIATAIRY